MLTAFNTFDENDNAEAKKKVQKVRKLAEKLHCSIVVMHHPSKANMEGTRKGSGAYAWARHADILINFNKTEDDDVIEIEMSKNRWSGDKPTIYIMKDSQYHLTLTSPPIYDKKTSNDYKSIAKAIVTYFGLHSRKDIYEYVQTQCGSVNTRSFDRVLKYLLDRKTISKDGHYGEYQISQRK
jgi:hypothetical protein